MVIKNIRLVKQLSRQSQYPVLGLLLFVFCFRPAFSQFTPGNLVVLQAGNGLTPLVNTGNQVVLKEFTFSGVPAFSVAVSTSVNPLIIGGTAVSEGGLSLTPNGKYLVFAGYANALTSTVSLSGTTAGFINRGIGIVSAAGNYSRIVTSANFYSGNSIRSAASDGNNNYWAAGANAGANYFGLNGAAATTQNIVTNSRNTLCFNGGLYFSTGSGTPGIYKVGSGYPIVPGQPCPLMINTSGTGNNNASPYSFFFNAAQTICYIADDRTPANGGGIQKWVLAANNWSLAYTLSTGAAYGARGVVADFSAPNAKIFATTSESSLNRLITITDTGPGSIPLNLATAAANTVFRGIAFSPYCSAPQTGTINSTWPVCVNHPFTLTNNVVGTAPISYSWSGPAFTSASQSPVITSSLSSRYFLSVANGCGIDTISAVIAVNPLPVVTVSGSTICPGGTTTLSANGAVSYSWTNAVTGNSIVVSPSVTSGYGVTGVSAAGCTAAAACSVLVTQSLTLLVNSESICIGNSATLTASGAVSFSWNTGAFGASIIITPVTNSTYTVEGYAPGCESVSAISHVVVFPLPPVSMHATSTICCKDDAIVTLSASPAGGIFSGAGVSANGLNPMLAGMGIFNVVYRFTDNNNCTSADSLFFTVDVCTADRKSELPQTLKIFPNPAGDVLAIDAGNPGGSIQYTILNNFGIKLHEMEFLVPPPFINIVNLQPGLYQLIVSSGGRKNTCRFIKQ